MLVLTRGKNDKVVFPTLNISVEVVRIAGTKVRLGIDAPQEVPVHRHEVADHSSEFAARVEEPGDGCVDLTHDVRNRLNAASLGLHLLKRKLEIGDADDAHESILCILRELNALEIELTDDSRGKKATPTGSKYRALVVEDDANERELLRGFLEASGFEVDTACDGMQAMIYLAREDRPDIVLLDMKMPRFDGGQTISAIRRHSDYRDLPVFAVSGSNKSELPISAGLRGVDRWFTKPLQPIRLVTEMQEVLTGEMCSRN